MGGADFDQGAAAKRGYGNKASTDFLNLEMKFAVKFVGSGGDGKYMTPELITGRHSDNPDCEGSSMGVNLDYRANPFRFRPAKESYHSEYEFLDWLTDPLFNFKLADLGRYVGLGFIIYSNKISDSLTTRIFRLIGNPNPDADPANWQELSQWEDKGGWGKDSDAAKVCNAPSNDAILTWAMPVAFRIKLQDPDIEARFKNWSCYEIDPNASPAGGDTPSPQFGYAQLEIRRHINFERTSSCSAGSSTNLVLLYEQLDQNGDTDLTGTNYKAGERSHTTVGKLYNKIIIQGSIFARKHGTGQTLYLRIRKASDNSIVRTLATWAAGSIGTSETELTFSDTGNTYRMKVDDRFSLESSGDSTDYISIFRHDSSTYDGDNSGRFTAHDSADSYSYKTGDLKAQIYGII
jgi:hypothetical protein